MLGFVLAVCASYHTPFRTCRFRTLLSSDIAQQHHKPFTTCRALPRNRIIAESLNENIAACMCLYHRLVAAEALRMYNNKFNDALDALTDQGRRAAIALAVGLKQAMVGAA